ncbi:MAG: hypothetical protein R2845_00840 [Thermomicrobiales bacterium]
MLPVLQDRRTPIALKDDRAFSSGTDSAHLLVENVEAIRLSTFGNLNSVE